MVNTVLKLNEDLSILMSEIVYFIQAYRLTDKFQEIKDTNNYCKKNKTKTENLKIYFPRWGYNRVHSAL